MSDIIDHIKRMSSGDICQTEQANNDMEDQEVDLIGNFKQVDDEVDSSEISIEKGHLSLPRDS